MAPIRLSDSTSALTLAQKGPISGLRTLWDPYQILDIYPNDPEFSCVGIAFYSNARCRWQFFDRSIGRAACARLDMIAMKHPSEVTRESLELLAERVLCHNHQKQLYEKIEGWERRIAEYLSESGERLAVAAEPEHGRQQTSWDYLKREIEDVRKEMESLKAERDEVQNRCTKSETEVEKLRTQQHQSLERSEQVEKRLKGKLVDSESTIQRLKEDARARLDEITFLNEQLADSQKSAAAKADEVQHLTGKLEGSTQSSERLETLYSGKIFHLNKHLTDRDAQVQELDEKLSESQKQTSNLDKCLIDSKSRVGRLENANQALRESGSENKKHLSRLEQQNQQLRSQKYAAAFRDAVQRLVMRKRYERLAVEKRTLEEERVALSRRLEEADMRVASKEVSNPSFEVYGERRAKERNGGLED